MKVHHNVLIAIKDSPLTPAGAYVLETEPSLSDVTPNGEVYNNTLDAGGRDMMITGAAVAIDPGCFLGSLRSNLIVHFPFFRNDGGAAAVRPGITESVVPAGNEPGGAKWLDLLMLVLAGGRERTEADWRDLLGSTGFDVEQIESGLIQARCR